MILRGKRGSGFGSALAVVKKSLTIGKNAKSV
jgi:hypothetical protein